MDVARQAKSPSPAQAAAQLEEGEQHPESTTETSKLPGRGWAWVCFLRPATPRHASSKISKLLRPSGFARSDAQAGRARYFRTKTKTKSLRASSAVRACTGAKIRKKRQRAVAARRGCSSSSVLQLQLAARAAASSFFFHSASSHNSSTTPPRTTHHRRFTCTGTTSSTKGLPLFIPPRSQRPTNETMKLYATAAVAALLGGAGQVLAECNVGDDQYPGDIQPVFSSNNGKLEVSLHIAKTDFESTEAEGGGFRSNVIGYHGCYADGLAPCPGSKPLRHMGGPTLRVKPGDDLIIHLFNDLPEENCKTKDDIAWWNRFHSITNTNIHVHGLFVPNTENDVLTPIEPGDDYTYHVKIREIQQG